MKTMRDAGGRVGDWGRGRRWRLPAAALTTVLLLSGCVTGGYPGQAGYPAPTDYPQPGGYPAEPGYPGGYDQRLVGIVRDIDLNGGRLRLAADQRGYGGGSQVEVYFDRNTRLIYQGRVQDIGGLERGDRISVDTVPAQGRLWAREIEVVQNVREAQGGGYYGGELSGAVSYVDSRSRLITITRGGYSGSQERVYYDDRTQVEYRGQRYRPEQLDPGDAVRIQARPRGNDWIAERIWVEVDSRSR